MVQRSLVILSSNAMGVMSVVVFSVVTQEPLTPILHFGIISTVSGETSLSGSDFAPSDSGDF